jgi:prephenate dehydrogenase
MSQSITSIGIIGFGSFGRFAASKIPENLTVRVYETKPIDNLPNSVEQVDFATVATSDVIILAIPLSAYPEVLEQLSSVISPDSVVVDICSVKVKPSQYVHKYLAGHKNLLITHPLFGPRSAQGSLENHQLIVTECVGERAEKIVAFCKNTWKLNVLESTSEEHDKSMALIHALTFFVGRGLSDMNLDDVPYETPSYKMLKDLISLDRSHSDELFNTIELGNPFAVDARERLIETFTTLNDDLKSKGDTYVV